MAALLLGRKIVEYDKDHSPPGDSLELEYPGLAIDIENCVPPVKSKRFSKSEERPNFFMPARESMMSGISSIYTADSSHTFGVPDFISTSTPDRKGKRKRTSLAEGGLATSAQSCSAESSPRDMQIRVLEQATALICARVTEAEEGSEFDQKSVFERTQADELDLEEFMTSERQSIDFDSHLIRRHLQHLSQAFGIEMDDNTEEDQQQLSSQDRQLANLATFLQTTLNRTGKRRRTMTGLDGDQVSTSMLMKRAMSLQDKRGTAKCRNASTRRVRSLKSGRQQNLGILPNDGDCAEFRPSVLASSGTERSTEPRRHRLTRPRLSLYDSDPDSMDGTVTIYQATPAQSTLEFLSELCLQSREVHIPQYAKDLMDDLEHFVDCIPRRVLTEPIGSRLPRLPNVVEERFPLSMDEDDQEYALYDSVSEESFDTSSAASTQVAPSPTQGNGTHTPSILRFGFRRTKNEETHTPRPRPERPVVHRKRSYFGLIGRDREDTTPTGTGDRSKYSRTIREMVSSWFRR